MLPLKEINRGPEKLKKKKKIEVRLRHGMSLKQLQWTSGIRLVRQSQYGSC